jgi:GNAT superfamily N-acetyltransferase
VSRPRLVLLRDGSSVTVRAVRAADEPALHSFLAALSLEAQRLRFFSAAANMDFAAHLGAAADRRHVGLIAFDAAGLVVGHVTYAELDRESAEVAVEVADKLHGQGLGTILLAHLAAIAEQRGIIRFVAEVLPENREMLQVFRDGFGARVAFREGIDAVEFATASWRLCDERFGGHSAAPQVLTRPRSNA